MTISNIIKYGSKQSNHIVYHLIVTEEFNSLISPQRICDSNRLKAKTLSRQRTTEKNPHFTRKPWILTSLWNWMSSNIYNALTFLNKKIFVNKLLPQILYEPSLTFRDVVLGWKPW